MAHLIQLKISLLLYQIEIETKATRFRKSWACYSLRKYANQASPIYKLITESKETQVKLFLGVSRKLMT